MDRKTVSGKSAYGILCCAAGIFLFAAGIYIWFCSIGMCFGNDIWFDELFTVRFEEMTFSAMTGFAAKDVHPPLYYYLVKLFAPVFSFLTGANRIAAIKLVSEIPYLILLIYSITLIRKQNGILTAGLFWFCILAMPQLTAYTVEARMYSFAMLFLTAMLLHGGRILLSKDQNAKDQNAKIQWVWFVIYGICAAYTQYFAAVCAAIIYGLLLIGILIGEKEKRSVGLKCWGLGVLISIAAYLPWMAAFAGQVGAVNNNYWIQPLTWRSLGGCIKYLCKPDFESQTLNTVAAVVLFAAYVAIVIGMILTMIRYMKRGDRRKTQAAFVALWGAFLTAGLIGAGFLLSALIRPIFVYRYLIPAAGGFWLTFACGIGRIVDGEKKGTKYLTFLPGAISILLCAAIVLPIGIRDHHMFLWEEQKKMREMEHTQNVLREIPEDALLVCNFNQLQALMWYYLPKNESVLYGYTEETLIAGICGQDGITMLSEADEIRDLAAAKDVLFLGTGAVREEICADWEASGMKVETVEDSCLLERYWFNIYRITLEDAGER